jgi:hypothetical protein
MFICRNRFLFVHNFFGTNPGHHTVTSFTKPGPAIRIRHCVQTFFAGSVYPQWSLLNRSGICDGINCCNIFLFMQPFWEFFSEWLYYNLWHKVSWKLMAFVWWCTLIGMLVHFFYFMDILEEKKHIAYILL